MQPNQPQPLPPAEPAPAAPAAPVAVAAAPAVPAMPPAPAAESAPQPEAPPEPPVANQPAEPQPAGPTPLPSVEPVQWQATEYAQRDKSPLWYVAFAAVVIVLMAAAILLLQTWSFALLIPVMAAALMVYTHRPPRVLTYALSEKGLHINDQLHPMGEFKSFGVIQEAQTNSLVLVPVKRFRPALTVYFPAEAGEPIVDLLGAYLPMQEAKLDAFDKIIRKLHI